MVADPGRRARLHLQSGGGGGGGLVFSLNAPNNKKNTFIIWVRHLKTEIIVTTQQKHATFIG